MIKITKAQLLGVIRTASSDEYARYAMQDIVFTPDEMVATDGRAMVKMRYGCIDDGGCTKHHWEPFRIRRDVLVRIAAGMRAGDFLTLSKVTLQAIVFLQCRMEKWYDDTKKGDERKKRRVKTISTISTEPNTVGRYPDCESVLEGYETKKMIVMDRELLISVLKNLEGETVVLENPLEGKKAMKVKAYDGFEPGQCWRKWKSFGAIMPMTEPEPVEE